LADVDDRFLPQPPRVPSVGVIEKRAVVMWSIVFRKFEVHDGAGRDHIGHWHGTWGIASLGQ
jgi:hypothetical protein